MSDEALRALERAARAAPDDLDAGVRFALALEKSGERRLAFFELAKLARAGSAAAESALAAWAPLPCTPGAPCMGRSGPGAAAKAMRRAELRVRTGDLVLPAASDRCIALLTGGFAHPRVHVLSARDLSVLWSATAGDVRRRGDELVLCAAPASPSALELREFESGSVLARVDIAADRLEVLHDRAVVYSSVTPRVARRVDIGAAFGSVLGPMEDGPAPLVSSTSLGGFSIEGRVLHVLGAPPQGRVYTVRDRFSRSGLALSERSLVAHDLVVDRATGRRRWNPPAGVRAVAVGASLVFGVMLRPTAIRIAALDIDTGKERFALEESFAFGKLDVNCCHALALEGALVVVIGLPNRAVLLRFE